MSTRKKGAYESRLTLQFEKRRVPTRILIRPWIQKYLKQEMVTSKSSLTIKILKTCVIEAEDRIYLQYDQIYFKHVGSLSSKSATQLGAVAIRNAVDRSKLDKSSVQEVYMGCVVQAGVGQAPATQAALFAG